MALHGLVHFLHATGPSLTKVVYAYLTATHIILYKMHKYKNVVIVCMLWSILLCTAICHKTMASSMTTGSYISVWWTMRSYDASDEQVKASTKRIEATSSAVVIPLFGNIEALLANQSASTCHVMEPDIASRDLAERWIHLGKTKSLASQSGADKQVVTPWLGEFSGFMLLSGHLKLSPERVMSKSGLKICHISCRTFAVGSKIALGCFLILSYPFYITSERKQSLA